MGIAALILRGPRHPTDELRRHLQYGWVVTYAARRIAARSIHVLEAVVSSRQAGTMAPLAARRVALWWPCRSLRND